METKEDIFICNLLTGSLFTDATAPQEWGFNEAYTVREADAMRAKLVNAEPADFDILDDEPRLLTDGAK